MLTVSSLLLLFILTFKFLSSYIKKIRTGDPNESDLTYWMFSYDFKSTTKDWEPEEKNLLILYLIVIAIFILFISFTAHLLEFIVNPKFIYPVKI